MSFSYQMLMRSLRAVALLSTLLVLMLPVDASAQRIVEVDPGFGTLNEAIESDTTDAGARVDTNTVYVLQRGGLYLTDAEIENRFPLTVVAAEGEGPRPIIQPGVLTGGESSRPFTPRGDLTLRGLYITNLDELGGLNQRIVRVRLDSALVIIDDCHLDKAGQSGIRLDNAWNTVKVTNSIFSNIGRAASLDNGRGVDTRGNEVDTLWMQNNTFYNLTSRVVRDGGGFINRLIFNHNTVVNVAQHGISVGEVRTATITNNLWANVSFLGQTDSTNDGRELIGIDSLLEERGGTQFVNVKNNRFYIDPAILDVYGDSVRVTRLFDEDAEALVTAFGGTGNAVDTLAFAFTMGPAAPADLAMQRWLGVADEELPDMDDGGGGPDASMGQVQLPFDFSYADTEFAFTAATEGQPLGDLNWFGLDIIETASEDEVEVPATFRLLGNYPNPFNPVTTLLFELEAASEVNVVVYDLLGRQVLTAPATPLAPGTASVRLDASGLASGVYLYRVTAEANGQTQVKTGRMVLLK